MLLNGCGRSQPKVSDPPPPEVGVSTPVTREITDLVEFTGHTEAKKTVCIRARVSGYLEKVMFKEGAEVREGDPLFEIDQRTYQADYDRTVANLAQSRAHLTHLQANYERAQSLIETRAISRSDFDQAVGDRDEAAAAVRVAEAALHSARLNLEWTRVAAPISGRISRQLIDPGNLVKADDTALTTIVSQDPIYAYFDIDERTMLQIRRLVRSGKLKSAQDGNAKLLLGLADEQGFPHEGTINFIDNQVDVPTGTLRLRGLFPNPNRILSPGLFVRIQVPIGDPHPSLLVSERALGSDQGQKFLYVLNEKDEVTYRHIDVGSLNDGLRVIQSGLKPGERVILSGLQRVRPGIKVNAKTIAMVGKDLPTAATAQAPAASPGAAPSSPANAAKMPATPQNNPVRTADPKRNDKAGPAIKSAAMLQNRLDF